MSGGRYEGDPFFGQVMAYGAPPPPLHPSPSVPFVPAAPSLDQDVFTIAMLRLEMVKHFETLRASLREIEFEVQSMKKAAVNQELLDENESLKKQLSDMKRRLDEMRRLLPET